MVKNNKELCKFILPYWKKGAIPLLCLLISSGITFIYPLFPKWALDNIVQNKKPEKLLPLVILFTVLIILEKLFSYFNEVTFLKFQKLNILDIQERLIKKIFYYPMAFFDKNHSGYLLGRIRGDIAGLNSVFSEDIIINLLSIVKFIVVIPVLLSLNVKLTIICLVIIPFPLLKIYISNPKVKELNKNILEENSNVTKELSDTFQGILVLKTNSKENEGEKRAMNSLRKYQNIVLDRLTFLSRYKNFVGFLIHCGEILLLYFGIKELLEGNLSIGGFFAFSGYLIFLYSPVKNINSLLLSINYAKRSYERLREFLDIIPENSGEKTISSINSLEVLNLKFSYEDGKELYDNLKIKLKKGERLLIKGESGSGKSTLIKLILGLYNSKSGKIRYNGIDIKDLDILNLRRRIGYISQNIFLFNKTIKENIIFNNKNISDKDLINILDKCKIKNKITGMKNGIYHIVSEKGDNFSGGEKQRIALARALIRKPDFIILDEATTNVDKKTEKEIENIVYTGFKDKIIIKISHSQTDEHGWKTINL